MAHTRVAYVSSMDSLWASRLKIHFQRERERERQEVEWTHERNINIILGTRGRKSNLVVIEAGQIDATRTRLIPGEVE